MSQWQPDGSNPVIDRLEELKAKARAELDRAVADAKLQTEALIEIAKAHLEKQQNGRVAS